MDFKLGNYQKNQFQIIYQLVLLNFMQSEAEKSSMNQQLAKQLMQLIDSNIDNAKVLHPTLNTIVQYTPDESSKLFFIQPRFYENIKLILNFPTYAPLHKICLTLLVHFSGCMDLQKFIIDKNIEDIIMKVRSGILEGLNEELGLLLLLNVSKNSYFAQYVLGVKVQDHPLPQKMEQLEQHPMVGQQMMIANSQQPANQQKINEQIKQKEVITYSQSVLLSVIYSFVESKQSRAWVIANIFVNLSSFEHGRRYVAQQKIYLGFMKFINHERDSFRIAVLRMLRNVAFLWDEESIGEDLMRKENQVIDNLVAHILIMLYIGYTCSGTSQESISQILNKYYQNVIGQKQIIQNKLKLLETGFKNKDSLQLQKSTMNEIQICVDVLVILSNTNWPEKKPIFCMQGLKQTISMLKFVKSNEFGEGSRDKLEALETFCLW